MIYLNFANVRVYLAIGSTDMRKSINGLSILVEERLELDLMSGHLFVFCNRRRTMSAPSQAQAIQLVTPRRRCR